MKNRSLNNCRDELVLKYEPLYPVDDIPEQEQYSNILDPAPLYHFPESGVISDMSVKDHTQTNQRRKFTKQCLNN